MKEETDAQSQCEIMMFKSRWVCLLVVVTAILLGLCQKICSSDVTDVKEQTKNISCLQVNSTMFKVQHSHDNGSLPMDIALLNIISEIDRKVTLCAQSDVCHNCALIEIVNLTANQNKTVLVYAAFPLTLHFVHHHNQTQTSICRLHENLAEHGNYTVHISKNKTLHSDLFYCTFTIEGKPPDSNIPVYVAIGIALGCSFLWVLLKFLRRHRFLMKIHAPTESLISADLGSPGGLAEDDPGVNQEAQLLPPAKPRLRSLDTFRGLSLIVMVFVNYAGGGYWFFRHSAWDGLTVADLVFPWFVFIMGTSIAVAFQSQLRRGISRKKIFTKVIRRSVLLFALGLMISNRAKRGREVYPSNLRICGVLQRLSFAYLIVAVLEVIFAPNGDIHQHKWWASMRDILPFWPEWLLALALLGVHLGITFLFPVPGCPKGYLGPGGLHENASHYNCTGGAAGYIDRAFFGKSHIYQHPSCMIPYMTDPDQPFDPEGILGSLTTVFLCFLGLQAGKIFLYHQDWVSRIKRLFAWCILTGVIAGCLSSFRITGGVIPVCKNLWSLSYILAMASMAYFLLLVCYVLVDVKNIWSGSPFFYPGMNSIVIYLSHEVLSTYFPVQFHVSNTHSCQLAMALWGATLWTVVSAILYYKKVFVAI